MAFFDFALGKGAKERAGALDFFEGDLGARHGFGVAREVGAAFDVRGGAAPDLGAFAVDEKNAPDFIDAGEHFYRNKNRWRLAFRAFDHHARVTALALVFGAIGHHLDAELLPYQPRYAPSPRLGREIDFVISTARGGLHCAPRDFAVRGFAFGRLTGRFFSFKSGHCV